MTSEAPSVPNSFFWRRLHSLAGLGLALFLIEHLLTNSRGALPIGDDGEGFIHAVNGIHSLPYLKVIEVMLIGAPLIVHGLWGIKYALEGRPNSMPGRGAKASLGYPRNWAYTFQRLTSWLLLIFLTLHVYSMRFAEYPVEVPADDGFDYAVRVEMDDGLYTVSQRLGVRLFDSPAIQSAEQQIAQLPDMTQNLPAGLPGSILDPKRAAELVQEDSRRRLGTWIEGLKSWELGESQIVALCPDFGTAVLLVVRDTMKSPVMLAVYTVFVLTACFHGFNGLWTFLITWGVTLTPRAQRYAWLMCVGLMVVVTGLGLASAWGTYHVNLIN